VFEERYYDSQPSGYEVVRQRLLVLYWIKIGQKLVRREPRFWSGWSETREVTKRDLTERGSGKRFVMYHGTSRRNWRHNQQKGLLPSAPGGALVRRRSGSAAATRNEEKAASNYMYDDGVVIKLWVGLARRSGAC
jgi:hypothetical protein